MESFSFAGFEFPRHIPRLVDLDYCGAGAYAPVVERLRAAGRKPPRFKVSASYYAAPLPLARREPFGERPVIGFYLGSDFAPDLRWQWCDECESVRIPHTGWLTDGAASDSIRGIVLRLPHARGFLAGHALGVGMSATVDREIYADISNAAHAADSMARNAAEEESAYQEASRRGQDAAAAHSESVEARGEFLALMRDLRRAADALAWLSGEDHAAGSRLCSRLRKRAEALADTWREKREERDRLRDVWGSSAGFADGYGV